MPKRYYECIPHTADLAIRVWGNDLPDLFAHAAGALFDMISPAPERIDRTRQVVVESIDMEGLLVDWLNQLIFLHEVNQETYACFEITAFSDTELRAVVHGGAVTVKHRTIKAATYHELSIYPTDAGLEANIIFDV